MTKRDWTKVKQTSRDPARLSVDAVSLATFNIKSAVKRNVREEKAASSKKARLEAKLRRSFEQEKAAAVVEAARVGEVSRVVFFENEQRLLNEGQPLR